MEESARTSAAGFMLSISGTIAATPPIAATAPAVKAMKSRRVVPFSAPLSPSLTQEEPQHLEDLSPEPLFEDWQLIEHTHNKLMMSSFIANILQVASREIDFYRVIFGKLTLGICMPFTKL